MLSNKTVTQIPLYFYRVLFLLSMQIAYELPLTRDLKFYVSPNFHFNSFEDKETYNVCVNGLVMQIYVCVTLCLCVRVNFVINISVF